MTKITFTIEEAGHGQALQFLARTTALPSRVPDTLGSAARFAFHLGAPVPGSAGTWISLPIDAQVTALTTAKPRVILWRHFSQRIYRRRRS
jgi:hypothetical protein